MIKAIVFCCFTLVVERSYSRNKVANNSLSWICVSVSGASLFLQTFFYQSAVLLIFQFLKSKILEILNQNWSCSRLETNSSIQTQQIAQSWQLSSQGGQSWSILSFGLDFSKILNLESKNTNKAVCFVWLCLNDWWNILVLVKMNMTSNRKKSEYSISAEINTEGEWLTILEREVRQI